MLFFIQNKDRCAANGGLLVHEGDGVRGKRVNPATHVDHCALPDPCSELFRELVCSSLKVPQTVTPAHHLRCVASLIEGVANPRATPNLARTVRSCVVQNQSCPPLLITVVLDSQSCPAHVSSVSLVGGLPLRASLAAPCGTKCPLSYISQCSSSSPPNAPQAPPSRSFISPAAVVAISQSLSASQSPNPQGPSGAPNRQLVVGVSSDASGEFNTVGLVVARRDGSMSSSSFRVAVVDVRSGVVIGMSDPLLTAPSVLPSAAGKDCSGPEPVSCCSGASSAVFATRGVVSVEEMALVRQSVEGLRVVDVGPRVVGFSVSLVGESDPIHVSVETGSTTASSSSGFLQRGVRGRGLGGVGILRFDAAFVESLKGCLQGGRGGDGTDSASVSMSQTGSTLWKLLCGAPDTVVKASDIVASVLRYSRCVRSGVAVLQTLPAGLACLILGGLAGVYIRCCSSKKGSVGDAIDALRGAARNVVRATSLSVAVDAGDGGVAADVIGGVCDALARLGGVASAAVQPTGSKGTRRGSQVRGGASSMSPVSDEVMDGLCCDTSTTAILEAFPSTLVGRVVRLITAVALDCAADAKLSQREVGVYTEAVRSGALGPLWRTSSSATLESDPFLDVQRNRCVLCNVTVSDVRALATHRQSAHHRSAVRSERLVAGSSTSRVAAAAVAQSTAESLLSASSPTSPSEVTVPVKRPRPQESASAVTSPRAAALHALCQQALQIRQRVAKAPFEAVAALRLAAAVATHAKEGSGREEAVRALMDAHAVVGAMCHSASASAGAHGAALACGPTAARNAATKVCLGIGGEGFAVCVLLVLLLFLHHNSLGVQVG